MASISHHATSSLQSLSEASEESTIKTYQTPWPSYACDWSPNSANFCTMALASFQSTRQNQIQLLNCLANPLDNAATQLTPLPTTSPLMVDYVATKVLWSPKRIKGHEYLASSGDGIYIWKNAEYHPMGEPSPSGASSLYASSTPTPAPTPSGAGAAPLNLSLTGRLVSRPTGRRSGDESAPPGEAEGNPPAPVTSFDWNRVDPTVLVTASYDTTCTVWCLETGNIKTQLIAHDKEVFDVAFSPNSADVFVSVGADGSLRLFDVRTLDHSTILYESGDVRPLLRVQWNPLDPNYLATFASNSHRVVVMDVRMPSVPAAELVGHQNNVVAMRWSPTSSGHLLSSDGRHLRLWELSSLDRTNNNHRWSLDMATMSSPAHAMSDGEEAKGGFMPVQQILWPAAHPEWIALTSPNQVSLLHL